MKNSVENDNGFDQPPAYTDSTSYQNQQNPQIKLEPHSPKHYTQQFYTDGYQSGNNSQYSFMPYSQENNPNKLNASISSYRYCPYDRPNSQQSQASSCNSAYLHNPTPSPSPKQCENCGFICESINQLTEHVNSCHSSILVGNVTNFQNYNILSGGEMIKTEPQSDILDLDSYKVHQVLSEEVKFRHRPHQAIVQNEMMQHQWQQQSIEGQHHVQPGMFSPSEQRTYMQPDQRMFSPNYQNASNQENIMSRQDCSQQEFNVEQESVAVTNQSPSPAKSSNWKSNDARKPKTYNCTSCNKWFTSSGHLKRHYNTTLHKNAVKNSGQPDPANLPISIHHHPKGEQNRVVDKQLLQHSPEEESERPASSNEQTDVPLNHVVNNQIFNGPPNVEADPSVMESRGLLSTNNRISINPTNNITFNNTINNTFSNTITNGFLPPVLMPMESPYYQMHPSGNISHSSPVLIINDTTDINNEDVKYTSLTSSTDNSQPLPSFSQIQRFSQMPYYSNMGGEPVTYSSYNLTNYNTPETPSYHYQEDTDRGYTLLAPPDSTSTDGDLLPITTSVNNNNLIMDNETPIVPNIKYNVHCSSPEVPNGIPDIENSNPQISSTSNIVKPQPLHKCFDCDKVFNKSCYLTQHNKTFHSGDKPFKCIRCGKRFSCEEQHLEHQAKHGGEKPHKCDQCPKQFNHKTDLRRHMCLHTGKKPFICDLCGKGFIRKDHMIKHGETHLKKPSKASVLNNTLHAKNY